MQRMAQSALRDQQRAMGQAGGGMAAGATQQQGIRKAALVVVPGLQADNGVIHAINEVLVPTSLEQQLIRFPGERFRREPVVPPPPAGAGPPSPGFMPGEGRVGAATAL
jgi:hypothetical protein